MINIPTKELILSRIRINKETDCWEWQRSRTRQGYGRIRSKGKGWLAHRLVYTIWEGPIPKGKLVCHRCNNPPCCNPTHLYLATNQENVMDAVMDGLFDNMNTRSLFDKEKVREIKEAMRNRGDMTLQSLSLKLGVSRYILYDINRGKSYKEA